MQNSPISPYPARTTPARGAWSPRPLPERHPAEQYCYGVRKFGIRIKAGRNGKLYIAHGLAKGITADEAFRELGSIVDKYDDFMILDIRTYPGQGIGPFRFEYSSDPKEIDALIAKYLKPEKYALTDFDDIKNVTLGDIRHEGKKYIILSSKKEYEYSCDCQLLDRGTPRSSAQSPRFSPRNA